MFLRGVSLLCLPDCGSLAAEHKEEGLLGSGPSPVEQDRVFGKSNIQENIRIAVQV